MGKVNLMRIAKDRFRDPLNTWPDHRRSHSCTLMGKPLFDYDCLRCWLERVLSEALETQDAEAKSE